jgi:hypothetical protein
MAKAKMSAVVTFKPKGKKSRHGVHAKTKNSVNKSGKNYQKKYRGQGR